MSITCAVADASDCLMTVMSLLAGGDARHDVMIKKNGKRTTTTKKIHEGRGGKIV